MFVFTSEIFIFLLYYTYRRLAFMVPWQCYVRETDVLKFHWCLEELIFTNILGHFPARGVTSHRGTTYWNKPYQSRLTLIRSLSRKSHTHTHIYIYAIFSAWATDKTASLHHQDQSLTINRKTINYLFITRTTIKNTVHYKWSVCWSYRLLYIEKSQH